LVQIKATIGNGELAMNQRNKLEECKKRLLARNIEDIRPLLKNEIKKLEKELKVILPKDLKELSFVCRYDYIDTFFDFPSFPVGVINKTIALRKSCNLPNQYVALSEGSIDMILLKTISEEKSQVLWICTIPDFDNICEGKELEADPDIYDSFTDFYTALLDMEEEYEKEQEEAEKNND
jgi:transcription elongation factor Elf1